MKNLLLCVLSLLFATALSAQDFIIKKTVTYKKFSNPNSLSYTIPKSEVFMIKYRSTDNYVSCINPNNQIIN